MRGRRGGTGAKSPGAVVQILTGDSEPQNGLGKLCLF
jgi:hypothetical protein